MDKWQPIESAPKDGTKILVYGEKQMFAAYWNGEYWLSSACINEYYGILTATHWMPLPNPPEATYEI